jgi:hypothetical protein
LKVGGAQRIPKEKYWIIEYCLLMSQDASHAACAERTSPKKGKGKQIFSILFALPPLSRELVSRKNFGNVREVLNLHSKGDVLILYIISVCGNIPDIACDMAPPSESIFLNVKPPGRAKTLTLAWSSTHPIVQSSPVQPSPVQFSSVQFSSVQFSSVQYITIVSTVYSLVPGQRDQNMLCEEEREFC